ncbi:MAG: hypothetical protein JWM33_1272 [Caulobacteraceae bacterium]|nr:hypothetical protein [Caulobacteraceae bacterium]
MKAGFTLMETLIGLAVLSMIMAGLTASLGVIGRLQRTAGESIAAGRQAMLLQRDLDDLAGSAGPFVSDRPGLTGWSGGFQFACGGTDCSARLTPTSTGERTELHLADGQAISRRLPADGTARFTYQGELGEYASWPPAGPPQTLTAIRLSGADGQALASAPLWKQHPAECEYDLIDLACRRPPA